MKSEKITRANKDVKIYVYTYIHGLFDNGPFDKGPRPCTILCFGLVTQPRESQLFEKLINSKVKTV